MSFAPHQKKPIRWLAMLCTAAAGMASPAFGAESSAEIAANAVISTIEQETGQKPDIEAAIYLTKKFKSKSDWYFIIAQRSNENGNEMEDNTVISSYCFVHGAKPDCSGAAFPSFERWHEEPLSLKDNPDWFEHSAEPEIVYANDAIPLLLIRTSSPMAFNGNRASSTFLFIYDNDADNFRAVFSTMVGHNNNEEVRFIDGGPLAGSIIVAEPGSFKHGSNPFAYNIRVYKLSEGSYREILSYRSRTAYGDGNRLAVIDSDMPEILRRLGFWKPGSPIPMPKEMPAGCKDITLRKGAAWCG